MFYIFTFFSFLLPFIESNTLQDLEMLYSDESGSCFESLYLGDSKMRTQFRVTLQSPYPTVFSRSSYRNQTTQRKYNIINKQ